MGGNSNGAVDGLGTLTIQRALDIARNTEGELDPVVSQYLELQLSEVWKRINERPDSYILNKDEFAIFNFYIQRFDGSHIAERAIARFWRHHQEHPSDTAA